MITDAHMHIIFDKDKHGNSEENFFTFVESVIQKMKNNSISSGILAQGVPLNLLDKTLKRYPNWFKGLLPIGNDLELNKKNIEKFSKNPNIVGVKIYPNVFKDSEIIKNIQPIKKDIENNNWIVQIHSNPVVKSDIGIPLEIVELATKTNLPIVMVHSGGHQFQQLSSWINHTPENLYFDTSAIQNIFEDSPYLPHLKWFLKKIPEGRLFWGSDFPDYSFEKALNSFEKIELDENLKNNILDFLKKNTDTNVELLMNN
ncbi:MAG: amidohydrolase family protein [Halanaerobiales bacterium]